MDLLIQMNLRVLELEARAADSHKLESRVDELLICVGNDCDTIGRMLQVLENQAARITALEVMRTKLVKVCAKQQMYIENLAMSQNTDGSIQ